MRYISEKDSIVFFWSIREKIDENTENLLLLKMKETKRLENLEKENLNFFLALSITLPPNLEFSFA